MGEAQSQETTVTPDICIYHGNCQDGFGAAWAVWKRFGDAVHYVPGFYGEPVGEYFGLHVVMVDFSYKRPIIDEVARQAKSLLILDHHKSAAEDLAGIQAPFAMDWERHLGNVYQDGCEGMSGKPYALFDMERSGAGLAWDFFHPDTPRPKLIQHIEDRDLWRFRLKDTRAISGDLFSRPYDFATYDDMAALVESDPSVVISGGEAIERKLQKDVAELLGVMTRRMVIGGVNVPVANLPYTMASEAAGKLAEGEPFAACYFDGAEVRTFSLRSRKDGMDVSAIAKRYGGGGHAGAAGFRVPIGWEGDQPGVSA